MNTQVFIQKYQGQRVPNNSGSFPGECVSLAARWTQEELGIPNGDSVLYCQHGGARDLWESPTALELQYFDRLVGTPQPGDLIIWGSNRGPYGHVAICIGGGQVFQQLGTPVFQPASTAGVGGLPPLGFLRKKGQTMATDQQIDQWISLFHQEAYGSPPSNDVFNTWRPVLKNNFVDGSLSIMQGTDTNAGALKNKPQGYVPVNEQLFKKG